MTVRVLDIAIAGAGPGGLAAALALNGLGHRVVTYDQFDAPRPLGSGLILQPTGLAVLDWLGLGERMRGLGARIDRLAGTDMSGRTVLDVRYEALGHERGFAVHRAALFNVLFEAVQAKTITLENNRQIKGLDDGFLILDQGRRSPRFDLVIDALGARSPLRSLSQQGVSENPLDYGAIWASLPWPGAPFDHHALAQRYDKASVMVGVLPIGRTHEAGRAQTAFFWSLKVKDHPTWKVRGLNAWKAEVLRYWPEAGGLLQHIQSTEDLVLARYQHHTLRSPFGHKLICIGDSAHSTSPQLGQGANMALLDVMALTRALQKHDTMDEVAQSYVRQRRRHVMVYQALSAMFTPFYQSDSHLLPWFRDTLVSRISRIAMAQRFLAQMVTGTLVKPLRDA